MNVYIPKNCKLLSGDSETGVLPIQPHGHYAIEASAGTGKTYTISKLFFDLVVRGVDPAEILVTTFTRAATAELKKRLHDEIRNAMKAFVDKSKPGSESEPAPEDMTAYWRIDDEVYKRLCRCDEKFGSVTISTVDSLVQRILRENAELSLSCSDFEVAQQFQTGDAFRRFMTEIVPNNEILLAIVSAYPSIESPKRTTLSDDSAFYQDLSFSSELKKCARRDAQSVDLLEYNALKFRDFYHFMESYRKWYAEFVALVSTIDRKQFVEWCERFSNDPPKSIGWSPRIFCLNSEGDNSESDLVYSNIYFRLTQKPDNMRNWAWFSRRLKELLDKKVEKTSRDVNESERSEAADGEEVQLVDRRRLSTQRAKRTARVQSVIDALGNSASAIESKYERFRALLSCLTVCCVGAKQLVVAYCVKPYLQCIDYDKQIKRAYEYDDFTRNLMRSAKADDEDGRELIEAVKRRWKCAIIDEFQDTNADQWGFLKKFFLDEQHQLFLIGDPKQAIYAFRGCDVFIYRTAVDDIVAAGQCEGDANSGVSQCKLTLGENFRSTPVMIDTINALYQCKCSVSEKKKAKKDKKSKVEENNENVENNGGTNPLFLNEDAIIASNYIDDDIDEKVNRYDAVTAGHRRWHCIDRTTGREVDGLSVYQCKTDKVSEIDGEWADEIVRILKEDYVTNRICFFDEDAYDKYKSYTGDEKKKQELFDEAFRPIKSVYLLCEKRTALKKVRNALLANGFVFEDTKKLGKLFGNQESLDLIRLMYAIDNPDNKEYVAAALNTMFFGLSLYDVATLLEAPESCAKEKFKEWSRISKDRRKYSLIFEDILKTTRFRERLNVFSTTEAPYWRVLRLVDLLTEKATYEDMTWHELVEYAIDAYWNDMSEDDDSDVDDAEGVFVNSGLKIQMKTIHSCKGLEADVVFTVLEAKKTSVRHSPDVCHEKVDGQWKQFIDAEAIADADESERSSASMEAMLESERLLYVALTRAKYRLHVPLSDKITYPLSKKLNQALEAAQPLIKKTGYCIDPAILEDLEKNCRRRDRLNLAANAKKELLTLDDAWVVNVNDKIVEYDALNSRLAQPIAPWLETRVRYNHSYSELKRQNTGANDADGNKPDNPIVPKARVKSALPGGTNTGLFLHEAFEKVDFERVKRIRDAFAGEEGELFDSLIALREKHASGVDENDDLMGVEQLFSSLERKYKFSNNPAAIKAAKRILYRTLTSIGHKFLADGMALCDADKVISEMEFLSNCEGMEGVDGTFNADFDMFNGSIDCACRFDDTWYIIDWKSDTLADYGDEFLRDHVAESYGNQVAIYTSAFKKWLASIDPNGWCTFGGMIYVFLRGVEPEGDTGFFWINPQS